MKKVINIVLLAGILVFCVLGGKDSIAKNAVVAVVDNKESVPSMIDAELETKIEEVIEISEKKEVKLSFTGDCSLGKLSVFGYEGTFYEMYDLYGPSYFFQNVKSVLEEDDMTLINFEGVFTDSDAAIEKEFNIKGELEFNQILVEGDIEAASFGNNHRIDYGQEGIEDTIAAFNEVNVKYAYDEIVGIYETENGVTIGFVSVNEVYDDILVEGYLEEGITSLEQEGVDLIVACCHWGYELHHYPEEYQTELGRKCIDWGADIVVGNHPHVLQGIDCYNGKYILYSLGNFCFGGNTDMKDKNTMIVQADFIVNGKGAVGEAELTVIPCTISSVEYRNDYCPTIVEGEKKAEIVQLVNNYSNRFGVHISEDGHVTHE